MKIIKNPLFWGGTKNQVSSQSADPEVILLDMKMPVMDGLELQAQILNLGIKVPIIFISAHSHREEIIRGFKSGANDFLS